MGVIVLDGSTVRDFAMDEEAFNKVVDPQFRELDINHDGVLSKAEIRPAFERLNLIETQFGVPVHKTPDELNAIYGSVFDSFDADKNGNVDLAEFREQMRLILLAIADGLGQAPVSVVVEDDSLLQDAVEHEQNALTYGLQSKS
ncbi:hypothetical protein O6H91_02G042400 [Diphasiastrum complanatum]|uniref:Uncharacterized protein n=2 Tax=Diphasiastrum complanatum TaxID=34168 RepID=A0ACC2EES8_DIPCM|nr:hypothetical protein O6H91_02G042300 [Diphasiastrum complanatum]KAJ7564973.1 hypothetical protein O6H91_02G042400 [Diphasiastrum complanatum]